MLKKLLDTQQIESVNKYVENLHVIPFSNYSLWKAIKNLNRLVINKSPLRNTSSS